MNAIEFDDWGRRRVVRAALRTLVLPADARILDAGCGSGGMLDELVPLGRAEGVDVSPAAVASTRARGHDARLGNVVALSYEPCTFDLVTCFDVLAHVRDDRAALSELRRVTRPGGVLLVIVPAYRAPRRYTRRSLRAAAAGAGWELVTCRHFAGVRLSAGLSLLALLTNPVEVLQRRRLTAVRAFGGITTPSQGGSHGPTSHHPARRQAAPAHARAARYA